jgi:hypothetical protein
MARRLDDRKVANEEQAPAHQSVMPGATRARPSMFAHLGFFDR